MPEQNAFEIPQQLRDIAEKNIELARTTYEQLMDAMTQAMMAWSSSSSGGVTAGFKAVQERAVQIAKENADSAFALVNELSKAKDLPEVLRLQSAFTKKQMESYARQAQDFGRLLAEATSRQPS